MVMVLKKEYNQLNVAVASVVGLSITQEHTRRMQKKILNRMPALSTYFQIFLIVKMMIQIDELVVPSNFGALTGASRYISF